MNAVYKCKLCGNVVVKLVNGGGPLSCCGQPMAELSANTTDAAQEKHVPVFQVSGSKLSVQVGDVLHPMTPEHSIQWILVEQEGAVQYATLTPDQQPKAEFQIQPGKPFTVYEYCNLHGLWKAESK